jgi:hypothetical protein
VPLRFRPARLSPLTPVALPVAALAVSSEGLDVI